MSGFLELPGAHTDVVSCLSFHGDQLAVGSWDSSISIYNRIKREQGDIKSEDDSKGETAEFALIRGIKTRKPVLDLCWGADAETLYFVGLDQCVWRCTIDGEQEVLSVHGLESNKVVYSKEQELVISTSWDGTMHVHRPQTRQYIRLRLTAKPFALALSSVRCVVAMAERNLSVYDLSALRQLVDQAETTPIKAETNTITESTPIKPESGAEGASSTAGEREILEVEPWQKRESSLRFMTRAVACMPTGAGFAASSIEGRVGVEWFAEEEQEKTYAFKCHRQTEKMQTEDGEQEGTIIYPVNALAFHPVHGTFATGGGDGVVALWDAKTKRRIKQYNKLPQSVAAIDFSEDGMIMAVAISPGSEDADCDKEVESSACKVFVRMLGSNEAKGKPPK